MERKVCVQLLTEFCFQLHTEEARNPLFPLCHYNACRFQEAKIFYYPFHSVESTAQTSSESAFPIYLLQGRLGTGHMVLNTFGKAGHSVGNPFSWEDGRRKERGMLSPCPMCSAIHHKLRDNYNAHSCLWVPAMYSLQAACSNTPPVVGSTQEQV